MKTGHLVIVIVGLFLAMLLWAALVVPAQCPDSVDIDRWVAADNHPQPQQTPAITVPQ